MIKGSFHPFATGFFVVIDGINHIVTAKHVIQDENGKFIDEETIVAFNQKTGVVGGRKIGELKRHDKVNWIVHDDPDVDLAILPIRIDSTNDDVMPISDKILLESEKIFETEEVIYVSFQPGIFSLNQVSPVIRHGIVSRITPESPFFIDGFSFPGNSGSPVFLKPILNKDDGKITVKSDIRPGKLIGVISASIQYREEAVSIQTGITRVVFEDNTGLSMVFPMDYLKQIIESKNFQEQLKYIKDNLLKKSS